MAVPGELLDDHAHLPLRLLLGDLQQVWVSFDVKIPGSES
jgi:hypothetical protein